MKFSWKNLFKRKKGINDEALEEKEIK